MKICPECSTENRSEAKFCKQCRHGFAIEVPISEEIIHCAQCHATNAADRKFCGACGSKLLIDPENGNFNSEIANEPQRELESLPEAVPVSKVTIKDAKPILPKVAKALVVKAYCSRIETLLRSKLTRLSQFAKRKAKQPQESLDEETERLKIKRILVIACVAGGTAVAASFAFSWLMSESPTPETAQIIAAPTIPAQVKTQDMPQANVVPPVIETVAPTAIITQPPLPAANDGAVSNKAVVPPVNQAGDSNEQPVKKKQTSNQQDLNRQRLLELKRQLGQ